MTPADTLKHLATALHEEAGLVERLHDILLEQRTAVAADDAAGVNAAVDDLGRLLLTLEQARRTRSQLVDAVAGRHGVSLDELEPLLPFALPRPVVLAQAELRTAAERAAHAARINHRILRRAVEAGDAFLQELFGTAVPVPAYLPADRPATVPRGPSLLLNRTA